jgi:hypothetical protein
MERVVSLEGSFPSKERVGPELAIPEKPMRVVLFIPKITRTNLSKGEKMRSQGNLR